MMALIRRRRTYIDRASRKRLRRVSKITGVKVSELRTMILDAATADIADRRRSIPRHERRAEWYISRAHMTMHPGAAVLWLARADVSRKCGIGPIGLRGKTVQRLFVEYILPKAEAER